MMMMMMMMMMTPTNVATTFSRSNINKRSAMGASTYALDVRMPTILRIPAWPATPSDPGLECENDAETNLSDI